MIGFIAALGATAATRQPEEAKAAPAESGLANAMPDVPFYLRGVARRLHEQLANTRGELALAKAELARARQVMRFSGEYDIDADLAGKIFDVSVSEGIDPELTFRIVRVESNFNPRAKSPVGAIGLAQVMVGTASYFHPGITEEKLYDPETNLRIGLRYLRALLEQHDGDIRTALLVYNRGPAAVQLALAAGEDPANGYEKAVLAGYSGRGVME